ncbi:unnamed protein product [Menidia menidia]|uniref:(Atlantic silverside) hypothetical protein n=1 Tax=Menidia menidia TaxID=238744 RepID=A0A8S4B117_9TELE|nr:unnamed protein product [Menidia menidia]
MRSWRGARHDWLQLEGTKMLRTHTNGAEEVLEESHLCVRRMAESLEMTDNDIRGRKLPLDKISQVVSALNDLQQL